MSQEEDKSTKRSSKAKLSPLIKPEAAPTATNFPSMTPRSSKKPSTRKFFGKSTNKLDLNWGECRAIQNVFPCKYNTHSHSSSSFNYFFICYFLLDREGQYPGTVRTMKWSNDGKYFAAAGQDKIVRVWMRAPVGEGLVLKREPFIELPGHTDEVLTLDWFSVNTKRS